MSSLIRGTEADSLFQTRLLGAFSLLALLLAAIGVVLGAAGALAATRVLARFLFDVKPDDPATLAAVIALLAAIALAAAWLPARRALRIEPVVALRDE